MRYKLPTSLALLLSSTSLLLASTLADEPKETTLVIYNSSLGLVHETKAVELDKGTQAVTYPDVATTIQTDSVNVRFPDTVALRSQQYRYDKITLDKILQAHIGQEVRFKTGPEANRTIDKGTLLATGPAVIKTAEGISGGISEQDILFSGIPSELIMKPSLVWNVDVESPTKGMLQLDYLISGIDWKSDYVIDLDQQSADLSGWVTVDNHSGKRFEDIKLHLLAGDINRVSRPRVFDKAITMRAMADAPVAHQAVEGYHFYSIPFDVTVADNEKTQIKFIDEKHHPVTRRYSVRMLPPLQSQSQARRAVSQFIDLEPLTIPLPKGTVRTYTKVEETTLLLGETHLPNTPKGEVVKLRLGTEFDIIAKEKLLERDDDKAFISATVEYTLTNRSDTPKRVEVLVPGVMKRAHGKTTITTDQPYDRIDGNTLRFMIDLKADETKVWPLHVRSSRQR